MRSCLLSILVLWSLAVSAQFIANKGQWRDNVLYRSDIPGGALFFESNKLTYHLLHPDNFPGHGQAHVSDTANKRLRAHAFEMNFVNGNAGALLSGINPSKEKFNFFIGKDTSKWASNVSSFEKVRYNGVYKGIDFLFYTEAERPKYDFIVHAGANVNDIRLSFKGADKVYVTNNELKIKLSFTDIIEQIPIAYQLINGRKVSVPCYFVVEKNVVSFKVGDGYKKEYDLVIDPLLIFSTYSGSTADNFGYTATYDEDGFLYSAGTVFWTGYPTTLGAYDTTFNGVQQYYNYNGQWFGSPDIGITKYDTSGTSRIYSTYLGGWFCEVPHSLIVNSKGELVVYGTTGSNDFPVLPNALDTSFGGGVMSNLANGIFVNYFFGSDIIVSKLSADGSQLLASTYYGGSKNDGLNESLNYNYADQMRGEVIVDSVDNIYIATCTRSADILNVDGFQKVKNNSQEGLLVKLSADLTSQFWASYLGGSGNDAVYSIVIDKNQEIVVAGGTTSADLAASPGVLFPAFMGGVSDGFVARVSSDGQVLNKLTYFGTNKYDQIYIMKMDNYRNIYVFGQSESMDSSLVFNANYYSINSGQFISKLKNDLSGFVWSTTFGSGDGRINISPTALSADICNRVYLTGWGSHDALFDDLPNYLKGGINYNGARGVDGMDITPDAYQKTTDGNDFYIMVLENDASSLNYASYFGGTLSAEHVDGGTSRFDRKGKIYQAMCAGCGAHSDMPIAPNDAVSPTNNSNNCNMGVFKMDFLMPSVIADFKSAQVCAGQDFQFKNTSHTYKKTTCYWNFGDGDTSTVFNPKHIFKLAGTYNVKLVLFDSLSCNISDSIVKQISVQAYKKQDLGQDIICAGESKQIGFAPSGTYNSYLWKPAAGLSDPTVANPIASPDTTTHYQMLADTGVCQDSFIYVLYVIPPTGFLKASSDADTILKGNSTLLHVTPTDLPVVWKPSSTLNDDTLFNPLATPLITTTYTVTLKTNATCTGSDSVTVFVYDSKCGKNDVYVPNVFTPNGDGKNDVLYVRGNNITELYFTIYDRWGEEVFQTTDQTIGWKGEYKIQSSDPAVFAYYLKVKCAGGKDYFEKGNITVMR